jgi:hypothetical protein
LVLENGGWGGHAARITRNTFVGSRRLPLLLCMQNSARRSYGCAVHSDMLIGKFRHKGLKALYQNENYYEHKKPTPSG